ncbi:electron transfer flavoprotein subunit beta/FixA family protein [Chloroflexi bacterium TSY]|nr:electron transfer flavoprotein subunit beta/FixA family protein [Chloroflexi bacterium TSY]
MKIVVLVKQTPDTAELPTISAEAVVSGEIQATMVMNPWDEFATEEAIDLSDRFDADSVAIAMGSPGSTDALKHALAMGVGESVLVEGEANEERDDWTTASILARAIQEQGEIDIILTGKQSVDGNSGSVFVGVARKLGRPLLVNVSKIVDIADGIVTAERLIEGGQETVTVPLPVVISVAKEINEPRYPSFMGIRKANRAKIPTLSASELSNGGTNKTSWGNIRKPEVRKTEVQMIEGATVEEKAAKLADALLSEKVL